MASVPTLQRRAWWRPVWVAARWLGNLAWLAVIAVALTMMVSARLSPDGNPNLFGRRLLVVLSGSMSPVMEAGDMVAVSPAPDPRELSVGDIITFRDPQRKAYVTHRIIERKETPVQIIYRTQGDANNVADAAWILPGQVVGRVEAVAPKVGYLVQFSRTRAGFFALVLVPGLILMVLESRRLWQLLQAQSPAPDRGATAADSEREQGNERMGFDRE